MTIVAVVCNVVLFLFTSFVLWTDGPPKGGGYTVLAVLLLLIPVLSAALILRAGADPRANTAVAIGNVALLGFVIWAFASAYPGHPEEAGVLPFAAMGALTPMLNLLVVLRSGARLKAATGT